MASELIYYCDPEKNTKCKKRSCFSGSARWQSCRFTRDIESAIGNLDEPLKPWIRKTDEE